MKLRSNTFEEKTRNLLMACILIQLSHESCNTLSVTECRKKESNKSKLFQDVENGYLTPIGNPKKTEFVVHAPIHKINWRIECKSMETLTNIMGTISWELNFIDKINEEKYCIVLSDKLMCPYFINILVKNIKEKKLQNKVWFGNLKQFETLLKQQIKKHSN